MVISRAVGDWQVLSFAQPFKVKREDSGHGSSLIKDHVLNFFRTSSLIGPRSY